jgi:hypothetical protein
VSFHHAIERSVPPGEDSYVASARSVRPVLSVEHLFVAGLGFDVAGAYLVSRGLLARISQIATLGATMYALEKPRATYAVEDRIRGTVGLVALVLGFSLQAIGYILYLGGDKVEFGTEPSILAACLGIGIAVAVPLGERLARPRWRDRLLVQVARFDWEGGKELRERPVDHVLRAFGEQTDRAKMPDESDVEYCARVFRVEAEHLGSGD